MSGSGEWWIVSRSRTVGLFALITILFGGAFPAIKVGVADVPPLLFAASRYYLSGTLLLVFALVTGRSWLPKTRNDRLAVAVGGTLFIGGSGLNFVGLQFTTSGVSAIIFALIPVLTVLASWILLPAERSSRRSVLGVLIGFVGVAIVVNTGPVPDGALIGNLLVLAAAVSVAIGTVLVKRCRSTMSVIPLTAWAMVLGATIQLAFSVALDESIAAVDPTVEAVLALLYLSVFAGAVAFVVYFQLIERIGPVQVNTMSYLTPITAMIIGGVLLGEAIPSASIAGFGVILAGFLLLEEREIAAELARFRGAAR